MKKVIAKTRATVSPTFIGLDDDEVVAITKPREGSNLHIYAWKKEGGSYVPALKTIYTICESTTPARLGKLVQKIMADVKEKREWASR